jgi:leader peptidase (prepilin peptidase)/N-methyltransferase
MIGSTLEIAIGLLVGATFGSFAGVALTRWSTGGSVCAPRRSSCTACGSRVGPSDNIPIVSFLQLKGRCRHCRAAIDPRVLWIEVACGLMGALVVAVGLSSAVAVVVGATGCCVVLATATDLERRVIPDRLTLPLAAVLPPLALGAEVLRLGVGWGGLASSLRTVAVPALLIPMVLALSNAISRSVGTGPLIGGGDVKLLIGTSAALGTLPDGILVFWLTTAVSGGSVALVGLTVGRIARGDRLPFAPFMLCGFIASIISSHPHLQALSGSP